MSLDTTLSITDIISVIAILLTLITILQIKQQRSDTLKPYITIKPYDKVYQYSHEKVALNENIKIFLSNIGNDLAKNISLELWLCDTPYNLLGDAIEITKNTFSPHEHMLLLLHHNLEFTYCESKEQKNIGIDLQNYFITICHIYTDLAASNKFKENQKMAKIAIKISYCNILGKNTNKFIALQLNPFLLSAAEIDFNIKTYELSKKEYMKLLNNQTV